MRLLVFDIDGTIMLNGPVAGDLFVESFTENLLAYGVGRVLDTETCRRYAPSRERPAGKTTVFPRS